MLSQREKTKQNTNMNTMRDMTMDELVSNTMHLLCEYRRRNLGNPFNYNRAFELMQAEQLGFTLTTVGGGSDGVSKDDPSVTAEFKATQYKGKTKTGEEKSHSFSYNGTSRQSTLSEQKSYCEKKVMRDKYHYWSIIDYEKGIFVKTIKISNSELWKVLWPKWEKSFHNPSAKDPRIGASISTKELDQNNIQYEIITH